MCNHQVTFPIVAGLYDIISVQFRQIPQNGSVYVSVGNSFDAANGLKLKATDKDATIKTSFPNKIYITLELSSGYDVAATTEVFLFDFFYID